MIIILLLLLIIGGAASASRSPSSTNCSFRPLDAPGQGGLRPVPPDPGGITAITEDGDGPCWVCGQAKDGHRHE